MESKSPQKKEKKSKEDASNKPVEETKADEVEEEEKLVKKSHEIRDFSNFHATIEQIEEGQEKVQSRLEAEAMLRKVGIHAMGKNPGEIMLLAASHGFINIIKFYECGMYPLHF